MSPDYLASILEIKHDSRSYPVLPDDAIVIKYMSKASTVSKGMEKILETPDYTEASPVSKSMEKILETHDCTDFCKISDSKDIMTETENQQTLSDAAEKVYACRICECSPLGSWESIRPWFCDGSCCGKDF
jgi:hypothetical protein